MRTLGPRHQSQARGASDRFFQEFSLDLPMILTGLKLDFFHESGFIWL